MQKKTKAIKIIVILLFLLNLILSTSFGLRVAFGGFLCDTKIILFGIPSTVSGFVMGQLSSHTILGVLIQIAILSGLGIKDIPDPYDKSRSIYEVPTEYHNKKMMVEMGNLNSLLENSVSALHLPIDKVPLFCPEQPLSLIEGYKLKSLVERAKARNHLQYFSEFIKKFSEYNANPEAVYEDVLEIAKQIKVDN